MVEYACAMVLMRMRRNVEPITVLVTAGLWLRHGNKVEIVYVINLHLIGWESTKLIKFLHIQRADVMTFPTVCGVHVYD